MKFFRKIFINQIIVVRYENELSISNYNALKDISKDDILMHFNG